MDRARLVPTFACDYECLLVSQVASKLPFVPERRQIVSLLIHMQYGVH